MTYRDSDDNGILSSFVIPIENRHEYKRYQKLCAEYKIPDYEDYDERFTFYGLNSNRPFKTNIDEEVESTINNINLLIIILEKYLIPESEKAIIEELLTPKEIPKPEKKLYPKDFIFHLREHKVYAMYIDFCKENNIPYDSTWMGYGDYYGIKNGEPYCTGKTIPSNIRMFYLFSALDKYLNEDENSIPDFCYVGYLFSKYITLCKKHNIPHVTHIKNSYYGYGIKDSEASLFTMIETKNILIFRDLRKLESFIINHKKHHKDDRTKSSNVLSREDKSNKREEKRGSTLFSKRESKIAVAHRLTSDGIKSNRSTKHSG